jgi:mannose-1-phosphate guanylyltransferase
VKAVILAGGKGTRLHPLTYDTPKQMLPIVGVPMLEWVAHNLARQGVTEIVLSMGYLPDRFLAAYPTGEVGGVPTRFVVEPEPLDTAGAIRWAMQAANIDETFVAINGDVICDFDIGELMLVHRARGGLATIATHPVADPSSYGVVVTDSDDSVQAFVEKPAPGSAPSRMISGGMYVLEPRALSSIVPGEAASIERRIFPELVSDGLLFARPDESYWLDTGTLSTFLRASFDVLAGRRRSPFKQRFERGSWYAATSSVHTQANVSAAVVDHHCRIDRRALVHQSILMPGAVIEPGAKVENSVVGPGAVVAAGQCVVDMIFSG